MATAFHGVGQACKQLSLWRVCNAGFWLAGLIFPTQLYAVDVASVRGIVHDSQHQPIALAHVKLKSASSDWQQSTDSNTRGEFAFMTVPLGDYDLSVSQPDYVTASQSVTVISGSAPIAHVQLEKGPALAAITVTAAVQNALPNTATPTTMVNRQAIERTPGADRSNSLAMITDFVPGAYMVHDQLHVRGGHQTTWAIDGVEIPNTNIASNVGPLIDPKDIDYLEIQRGSYEADQGDRTYGVFNVVPRTGFERDNQAELIPTGGNYGQTNDYLSIGNHTERLAYYASVNGNRSDLGIQTPTSQILHDRQTGYGGFSTLIFNATAAEQVRVVFSARRDNYQIPNRPEQLANDVQRESDLFSILSWVRKLSADAALTTSIFYHQNRADLDGAPNDYPISTADRRSSAYFGGQTMLRFHVTQNDIAVGVTGFSQHDQESFNVLFNDGSNAAVNQTQRPSGSLIAAYIEDTFKATDWLQFSGGIRQTHFVGGLVETATSPRLGVSVLLPGLNWIFRGFWGKYYQAPPLTTLSGPLLEFAKNSNSGFLPLRGERDEEYQIGVTIPIQGWTVDVDHFHTAGKNVFDHNNIGNSNAFLPITIAGALIQGNELTLLSPKRWSIGQLHVTYSNQTAEGHGSIAGGLTNFNSRTGSYALDHDQRNTANIGYTANLPRSTFASANVSYGSGISDGSGQRSHLPSHAEINLSAGKTFKQNFSASLTVLNLTNHHLLVDNSLTFGGFHYNDPRQIYAQVHYKFAY